MITLYYQVKILINFFLIQARFNPKFSFMWFAPRHFSCLLTFFYFGHNACLPLAAFKFSVPQIFKESAPFSTSIEHALYHFFFFF
jgi:hypothetical protein